MERKPTPPHQQPTKAEQTLRMRLVTYHFEPGELADLLTEAVNHWKTNPTYDNARVIKLISNRFDYLTKQRKAASK